MLQALIVPSKQPPTARRDYTSLRASRARGRIEAEILALYIAGWSEADPHKIADATAAEYVLDMRSWGGSPVAACRSISRFCAPDLEPQLPPLRMTSPLRFAVHWMVRVPSPSIGIGARPLIWVSRV